MAVRETCPANRSRKERPPCSGVAQKGFLLSLLSFLPKMRMCMLMRGAGEQISSVMDQQGRSETNHGREITDSKSWRSFTLL